MNIDLTDEAVEFGVQARRALEAAGGDDLVQRAERAPEGRADAVAPVLAELGAWDLDVRSGADELEAAAALCRSAGYWAVPYPVAERLARPAGPGAAGDGSAADGAGPAAAGLVVVDGRAPAGRVAGLDGPWATVTLDGRCRLATPLPPAEPPRRSAFVAALAPQDGEATLGPVDVALGLVLPCWTLLGMLDRAVELTRAYVGDRRQFGQALASFQGVQFQLTEAEVERAGVAELAGYALWSIEAGRPDAVADALALRLAAVEAAEVVFRITHQLHGAIGFCDETVLSWLSRHSQPLRRLPFGPSGTRDALTRALGRRGLSGLFDALAPGGTEGGR